MELIITKTVAALVLILPEGISLLFVLGLSESNLWSAILLKPIAAFLAKTMQRIMSRSKRILKCSFPLVTPRVNPIRANGMANRV
jgi:hypothetical protein